MHHPYVNCSIIHNSQVWKQPKHAWIDEWIHYMCLYTYVGMLPRKKSEILSFSAMWMGLEGIMLSVVS